MASDKAYSSQDELMNTNWQDKINQAVAAGDYDSAAKYESARNDKINSSRYTGSQTTTNNYQSSSSSSSSKGSSSSSSKTTSSSSAATASGADMSRRTDLAGMSVKQGSYTVTYDSTGRAVKTVKDGGASANNVDASKTQSLNQLAASNQYLAAAQQAAQSGDWDAVGVALNNYTHNSVGADANGEYNMKTANDVMSLLGDVYGYNAEAYYKDKYESVYGEGSWDGTTGTQNAGTQTPGVQAPTIGSGLGTGGTGSAGSVTGSGGVTGGTGLVSGGNLGDYLEQWFTAAKEQQELAADFAVSQGVNELTRAEEDAKVQFQTQRNQIAADEAKAKDNQALYAEARGDKGGIGAAQYDSIMNTAAMNRQAVNQAQTKLSTDTARQIADLRAQGEFEKADKLLQLTQQYLSQLASLEQWALEYQLDIDKFNVQMQQWAKEFELAVSEVTGTYNGLPTLNAIKTQYSMDQDAQKQLASAGETLLSLGIMPSASQLEAMGMTSAQAQDAITAAQVAAAAKKTGGSGSSSSSKGMTLSNAKEMAEMGQFTDDVLAAFKNAGYNTEYLVDAYGYERSWVEELEADGHNLSEYTITNLTANDESWIYVAGMGQLTAAEIDAQIRAGRITVIPNKKTKTLTFAEI